MNLDRGTYLYTDGSLSRKKYGGCSFVIVKDDEPLYGESHYIGQSTTPRAELSAVILGLMCAVKYGIDIDAVVSDATIVTMPVEERREMYTDHTLADAPNGDLWEELIKQELMLKKVPQYIHIDGHQKDEVFNNLCDVLAKEARMNQATKKVVYNYNWFVTTAKTTLRIWHNPKFGKNVFSIPVTPSSYFSGMLKYLKSKTDESGSACLIQRHDLTMLRTLSDEVWHYTGTAWNGSEDTTISPVLAESRTLLFAHPEEGTEASVWSVFNKNPAETFHCSGAMKSMIKEAAREASLSGHQMYIIYSKQVTTNNPPETALYAGTMNNRYEELVTYKYETVGASRAYVFVVPASKAEQIYSCLCDGETEVRLVKRDVGNYFDLVIMGCVGGCFIRSHEVTVTVPIHVQGFNVCRKSPSAGFTYTAEECRVTAMPCPAEQPTSVFSEEQPEVAVVLSEEKVVQKPEVPSEVSCKNADVLISSIEQQISDVRKALVVATETLEKLSSAVVTIQLDYQKSIQEMKDKIIGIFDK